MDQLEHRIIVETLRHRITGTLALPPHGYRSRLSDFLNSGEVDFVALTDADIVRIDGGGPDEHADFVSVSRLQILLAMPEPTEDAT